MTSTAMTSTARMATTSTATETATEMTITARERERVLAGMAWRPGTTRPEAEAAARATRARTIETAADYLRRSRRNGGQYSERFLPELEQWAARQAELADELYALHMEAAALLPVSDGLLSDGEATK